MEFKVTVPYAVEAGTLTPLVGANAGAVAGDRTILVTFKFVVPVAATVTPVMVPVENPAVKVPEYVPSAALVGLAALTVEADAPEAMLANAAAVCAAVTVPVAVKLRPFTVTLWPAVSWGNVNVDTSGAVPLPSTVATVTATVPVAEMLGITFPLLSSVAVALTTAVVDVPVVKPSVNLPE